jgi:hypothetical protein
MLATLDGALWVPTLVYAVTLKYQMPGWRRRRTRAGGIPAAPAAAACHGREGERTHGAQAEERCAGAPESFHLVSSQLVDQVSETRKLRTPIADDTGQRMTTSARAAWFSLAGNPAISGCQS